MKAHSLSLVLLLGACARSSDPPTTVAVNEPPSSGSVEISAVPPEEPVAPVCTSSGFMSYVASPEAYDSRHGLHATRFSELITTHAKPLEECSLNAVLERLVSLRCDDGSNPFQNNMGAAHMSRVGSMGSGGRCGAVIDMYEVPCPEARYSVYADLYFCPAGRSPM